LDAVVAKLAVIARSAFAALLMLPEKYDADTAVVANDAVVTRAAKLAVVANDAVMANGIAADPLGPNVGLSILIALFLLRYSVRKLFYNEPVATWNSVYS
jgi:hypothetical protein